MKLMRTYRIGAMLGVLVLVMVLIGGVANAGHSWSNYHWARTSNPFTLQLIDSVVDDPWDAHLSVASTDWSAASVLDTKIVAGAEDGKTRKQCPAASGYVRVCDALYGFNGWLGVATIWVSGDHIVAGTTKLNDSYLNNPRFITPYETPAWRQYVMCQEPGHNLGLGHQDEVFDNANLGSCMDYTDDPDGSAKGQLSNLHPNQHDYDQLESIYAHLDSTTTVAVSSASSAGRGSADNGQDDWGRAIRTDAQGRPNLFEKDLGGGDKVFTWVFWTVPGQP